MKDNDLVPAGEKDFLRQLGDLADDRQPPEHVERRIVDELRARNLLRSRGTRRRWFLPTAAAVLLFLGGVLTGRGWNGAAPAPPPPGAHYALFLLGGVEPAPDEAVRVEEFRTWARELAREGRLVGGEKLAPTAWLLAGTEGEPLLETAPAAHRAAPLSGYFLLTVDDPGEALEIARSCPHLRYGGEVLLRPIEPT